VGCSRLQWVSVSLGCVDDLAEPSTEFLRFDAIAVCCSVLQCAAVCCSVLQCVNDLAKPSSEFLRCSAVAVFDSVLQCAAVSFLCLYDFAVHDMI